MKITIVLPRYGFRPVGGYKVQYEYANHLQRRGHSVAVVHPWSIQSPDHFASFVKSKVWSSAIWATQRPKLPWFRIEPGVDLLFVRDLRNEHIPNGDIIVATAWQTAEMIRHYPESKGKKVYMIYDYEFWMTMDDAAKKRVAETYHAGFEMVATSPAVSSVLEENNVKASAYIPCGISMDMYGIDVPLEKRTWGTIGFPVRKGVTKGTKDAIECIKLLKQEYGDGIKVSAFGPKRVDYLPSGINFLKSPTDAHLRAFYNSLSIFLFPSHYEGWGLPGMEALACGSALVASDSVGLRDYAQDGKTALLVPRKRPDLLATAIKTLLSDDMLRQKLAYAGHRHVQQYTWKTAVDKYEDLLNNTHRAATSTSTSI